MNTRTLRHEYGISQKELARGFGIPLKTVQSWEYKDNMPEYVWNMLNMCFSYVDAYQKKIGDSDGVKEVLQFFAMTHKLEE